MWSVLLVCGVCGVAGATGPVGDGARYWATTTVLAGDEDARGAELGYRLRAALAVRPLHARGADVLLHFTLESPQLLLRGKKLNAEFVPRPSHWDSVPTSEFLAEWSAGRISQAYLDANDPPDILDFKKSLISLFQYQVEEGEYNETDSSGECEVLYERAPDSETDIRKIKHRCLWEGRWDDDDGGEDADGADGEPRAELRRVARLALGAAGELRGARVDELARLRGAGAGALTARALLELAERADLPAASPAVAASRAAALAAHPALTPHALPLKDRAADDGEEEALESALAAGAAALDERRAGSAAAAAAALRLLPALRRAPAARLLRLLQHPDSEPQLSGLARMLGLAGTAGAHAAAREALALAAPPRPAPAREYLAALAHAPAVDARVLRAVLALGAGAGAVAGDALLAAAAAAARAEPALQLEVKDELLKGLARCKEDECRTLRLQALGQLRRGDVAELLLEHAERGARGPALAALDALADGPRGALSDAGRARLERVVLALDADRPLEVRAAALELVLATAPRGAALRPLVLALRAAGPRELRRLAHGRLRARAARDPALAAMLPALDPRAPSWLRRAFDGTSSVLSRSMDWAELDSTQLAARGVLRRGAVRLRAAGRPLLTVELWTRGMESLASAAPVPPAAREPEDAAAGEDAAPAGGLALAVAGARRRGVALFGSQAELLGLLWAGAGSEPTPALRALLPRRWARALPLAGVLLAARADTAVALAMDAHAQVSLWGRTARAGLELRGAGVQALALAVRGAPGRLAARAEGELAPALRLAAALDFYAEPQLCVHVRADDYTTSRNVTLESSLGATRWLVRRVRRSSRAAPGRTLALAAPNDQACRALGAA